MHLVSKSIVLAAILLPPVFAVDCPPTPPENAPLSIAKLLTVQPQHTKPIRMWVENEHPISNTTYVVLQYPYNVFYTVWSGPDANAKPFLEGYCGPAWYQKNFPGPAYGPAFYRTPAGDPDSTLDSSLIGPRDSPRTTAPSSAFGQASQDFVVGEFAGAGAAYVATISTTGVAVELLASDSSVVSTTTFPFGFTPNGYENIISTDFNGDGKTDLAVSYSGDSSGAGTGVSILLGNGDGTFGKARFFPSGGLFTSSLAAGDFNGDGTMDVALAGETTVSVLLGDGQGALKAPATYPAGSGAVITSLIALDLNGDNLPDVAVSILNKDGSYGVAALLNRAGQLGQPIVSSIPSFPVFLAFDDLNHDGKQDVLVAAQRSNALILLQGNGDGTFEPAVSYPLGNQPASLGIMPAPDGSAMIFSADDISNETLVTLVSPQGVIAASRFYFVGGSPTGIATADLNGDGLPDVVITGGSSDVSVVLSESARQFQPAAGYSLGQPSPAPQAVAIGDLNGDGKPDVIVANAGAGYPETVGPGSVSVLLGNSGGALRAPTSTAVNQNAQSLALADFNGDGRLDVAVAAYGTLPGESGSDPGALSVLPGKGDGTFQPAQTLTTNGLHPVAVATGDLNKDGRSDLAVLMAAGFTQPATLAVFLNQGNGAFAAARTFALQAVSFVQGGVAIGDVNGDGKPDIAMVTGDQTVEILLGDGLGGFTEASTLPTTETGSVALVMTDFNGDGNLDLIIAHCCGESDTTYLLGNGDGTFQAEVHYPAGSSTTALAVTRFSGSNGPDVVISHQGGTWIPTLGLMVPAAAGPLAVSTGPGFGTGNSQTFTFNFSDSGGYQNLSVVDVLIASALDGRHACYVAFVPSGASGGSVYLVDDAGDAGGPYQGLVLPGGGTVSNSQCTVSGTGSSASGSGNNLTLTLAITFSASFSGNKVVYTSAGDKTAANSGWQALGTWGVPGAPVSGPSVTGMSPARTSSLGPTTYTFTFSDTNGWQDIAVADILINSAINGQQACYIAYVPSSASVLLVDDAGDAGGPYQGMVLPGSGTVSNSQCTISAAGSSVTGGGNTLTLNLAITFAPIFAGNQLFFLAARNNTLNSNWQAVGSVTVP